MVKKISLVQKLSIFNEHWTPKILGEVNDSYVKVFKAKGDFVWHSHENEDELFLVLHGVLGLKVKGQEDLILQAGELVIIPRGVQHCPYAEEEAHVLLFEPKGVINTGEVEGDLTRKSLDWI